MFTINHYFPNLMPVPIPFGNWYVLPTFAITAVLICPVRFGVTSEPELAAVICVKFIVAGLKTDALSSDWIGTWTIPGCVVGLVHSYSCLPSRASPRGSSPHFHHNETQILIEISTRFFRISARSCHFLLSQSTPLRSSPPYFLFSILHLLHWQ